MAGRFGPRTVKATIMIGNTYQAEIKIFQIHQSVQIVHRARMAQLQGRAGEGRALPLSSIAGKRPGSPCSERAARDPGAARAGFLHTRDMEQLC